MEENHEAYGKIDGDTKDILEVLANVNIPEKFKKIEEGEERYEMCKAFGYMRQEGYDDGKQGGIQERIRILIQAYQN